MEKSIKGSQTEKNLLLSFAGEGQARNRYTFWSSKAKKDGFVQISNIFTLTANQEKEHAERFFKFLQGGEVKISGTFPAGVIASTLENLQEAAANEHEEGHILYPSFALTAEEEGFFEIADTFHNVSIAEKAHEQRYLDFAHNIIDDIVFKRKEAVMWQCSNCGFVILSKEAPELCPSCKHARDYFELQMKNW